MVSREELLEIARSREFLTAVAVELTKHPDLMRMIAEAALGRVAMKEDVDKLRSEMREEIGKLREEMGKLGEELRGEFRESMKALKDDIPRYVDMRFSEFNKRLNVLKWTIWLGFTLLSMLIVTLSILRTP
ncbi:MAG: hypothetical protein ACTSXX_09975 [Candidatus Baldrarchaeia archaeon]